MYRIFSTLGEAVFAGAIGGVLALIRRVQMAVGVPDDKETS
jgi:hypothetical protein